jgi:hypothetical protein
MKKLLIYSLLIFTGCIGENWHGDPQPSTEYKPIIMDKSQLESSIAFQSKRDMNNPGKIYQKGNYIFVSERYQGVHVIDNTNPSAPVSTGFIRVPGCLDMAVKSNTLYVDNATDLVAIDLSDPSNPQVRKRVKDVFPELFTPDGNSIPFKYNKENRPANTVIVGWEKIKSK